MRILPGSLFGRLVLVLLSGLILAQLMAMVLSLRERDQVLVHFSYQQWAQRDADAVRLMDTLSPPERKRVAAIRTSPRLTVTLAPGPAGKGVNVLKPDKYATAFQTQLRELLPDHTVGGYIVEVPVPFGDKVSFGPGYRTRSVTEVRLQDGTWVKFDYLRPVQIAGWPYPLLVNLAVLLVGVILLSLIAVRWLTRPLTTLANAADELGRDIRCAPVPQTGPLEVRRAARAFNEMQTRLLRYIDDRTRLLTAVSHDLKTPITRLRLRAEMLDDETLKEKFVDDLHDMEAMTNSALDFLRGLEVNEAAQLTDLNAMLESLQADAEEFGQSVRLEGAAPSRFPARPLALRRCLDNLVNNALRHGSEVTVAVETTGSGVTIRVRDTGPGIPEDQLEKVFEPFYRLDTARGCKDDGTGLGLGIARNIAELHGGHLQLHNHPEGGLEAILWLPSDTATQRVRSR